MAPASEPPGRVLRHSGQRNRLGTPPRRPVTDENGVNSKYSGSADGSASRRSCRTLQRTPSRHLDLTPTDSSRCAIAPETQTLGGITLTIPGEYPLYFAIKDASGGPHVAPGWTSDESISSRSLTSLANAGQPADGTGGRAQSGRRPAHASAATGTRAMLPLRPQIEHSRSGSRSSDAKVATHSLNRRALAGRLSGIRCWRR